MFATGLEVQEADDSAPGIFRHESTFFLFLKVKCIVKFQTVNVFDRQSFVFFVRVSCVNQTNTRR